MLDLHDKVTNCEAVWAGSEHQKKTALRETKVVNGMIGGPNIIKKNKDNKDGKLRQYHVLETESQGRWSHCVASNDSKKKRPTIFLNISRIKIKISSQMSSF